MTRPGGRLLLIDQSLPTTLSRPSKLDRFERARDLSHTRLCPDVELRSLFDSNGLVLLRSEARDEERELEAYLDLAACDGEGRERWRARWLRRQAGSQPR